MRPDTIVVLVLLLACFGVIAAMSFKSRRAVRPDATEAAPVKRRSTMVDSGLPPEGDPRR